MRLIFNITAPLFSASSLSSLSGAQSKVGGLGYISTPFFRFYTGGAAFLRCRKSIEGVSLFTRGGKAEETIIGIMSPEYSMMENKSVPFFAE